LKGDEPIGLLAIGYVTLSRCFRLLVAARSGTHSLAQSFQVGQVSTTPFPEIHPGMEKGLAEVARRAWSLTRSLDSRTETSHALALPALLQMTGTNLAARTSAWLEHVSATQAGLDTIQAEIDARCFDLYGIDEVDRRSMTKGFGTDAPPPRTSEHGVDDDNEDGDASDSPADAASLADELVSWATGIAFGRFDVRLATGARALPAEPGPFDPLRACSPGMLVGDEGMPPSRSPVGYPLAFHETGVLVHDAGHANDLTAAVRRVFDVVLGTDADRWWDEVASRLDPKGQDLRAWLAGDFFERHIKQYSKSRRKAPIYWQLATPSAKYAVWVYYHRISKDTFYRVLEFVGPKVQHEDHKLTSMRQEAGPNPTASQRKELAAQEEFLDELRAFQEEVARIAPLWNPNLDDGVIINFAPLWRLVPQHKAWQREVRACWDRLVAGEYDWSHHAMHLWPERVVPKCRTGRSLAIAHGLEERLWEEGTDGKWRVRTVKAAEIDALIKERTSSTVKDALEKLLNTPGTIGTKASGVKKGAKARSRSGKTE